MNGTTRKRSPGRKGTPQTEPKSKLPQSVADVLQNHVMLEVECIDRMYLNAIVPRLQITGGAVSYIRHQKKAQVASTNAVEPMTRAFVQSIERFVEQQGIPMVQFLKGQRKEDVAAEMRRRQPVSDAVVFVGKAQEKCSVYRTEKRHNPKTQKAYAWIVKSTALVNHYYFYCVDENFGPFFLKFCSYFPYNAKLCLNGHEYAKRQLEREGIAYEALDNGIRSCADPKRLQQICDSLSAAKIDALLRKWLARLPHPYPAADRAAGYRYQLSIWQIELSLTQVLDRPVSGRVLFEDVIRENLDLGRPGQVQLIFDRGVTKSTPGPFRTRVITDGVIPSLHIDYKGTRIKQYHKEGQALRTETTINNSRDFYIGKALRNLAALRRIGFHANRRVLEVETITHDSLLAEETLQQMQRPRVVDGQRVAALRMSDPTVQALWQAMLLFELLPAGFSNRQLRAHLAQLLGLPLQQFPQGRMSYHLRRLRLHGMIERIPKTHRYRLTDFGLRTAMFCTRAWARIFRRGLGMTLHATSPIPNPIQRSFNNLTAQIHAWVDHAKLAA
jgi:hypothetical protein